MRVLDVGLSALDRRVVGRNVSFFASDLANAEPELRELIEGQRLLVIGGAGSIGANTLRTLLHFRPAVVHVVDHNENGLAELVRSLRSSPDTPPLGEFQAMPFGLGGQPLRLWLASNGVAYDHVLNFAALKHVRTEKDPFSILSMLETNVLHLDRVPHLLGDRTSVRRVFSVSTDKAANPSSMMGATKRLMEHALFHPTQPWADGVEVSSTRFANVAFSNGSLLQSWQYRLAAGHPLACPEDTRRFFVSLTESGHLCALVAFLGADRSVMVPSLDPDENLVLLSDVAGRFLEHHGFEPHVTHDEREAIQRVDELRSRGRWPLLLTPLDTSGEKPYEEFVGAHESVRPSRFSSLETIPYLPPGDRTAFPSLVEKVRGLLDSTDPGSVTIDGLRALIAKVEPSFAHDHRASTRSLDQRM